MVKINKKGQQIANFVPIVVVVFITALFIGGISMFGAETASDPNNKLTQESRDFIYEDNGFTPKYSMGWNDTTKEYYSIEDNTTGSLKDESLEFSFYRQQAQGPRSTMNDFFDLPNTFLKYLGFDLGIFAWIITLLMAVLVAIVIVAVYKFIRGRI